MGWLSSRLNVWNWATWVKLLFGLMIATITPLLVVLVITQNETVNVSDQALRRYLTDVAQLRVNNIDRSIDQAGRALESIVRNRLYRSQLLSLVDTEENSFLRAPIINLFENRLIESELFSNVQLVDASGRVIADTRPGGIGRSIADTATYRAGTNASVLGDTQALIISQPDGENRIDIVQLLNSLEGELEGFLIGELNLNAMILDDMRSTTAYLPVYTYAVSRNGYLFVPDEYADRANNSRTVNPELTGQSGFLSYTDPNNERVLLFYDSAISGRMTVVTETIGRADIIPSPFEVIIENLPLMVLPAVVIIMMVLVLNYIIVYPVRDLRPAIRAMVRDDYDFPVRTTAQADELGLLTNEFVNLRERVRQMIEDQNNRVQNLTRDIQATQEVSRYAAFQRESQELMDNVVNLILRQFPNIYHAQVFLIDDDQRYALLKASTGDAGHKLLARGHRLAVGSTSVIGQVTQRGVTIVARDAATSEVHRRNEFLPDTRAELAIPLRIGDRVFGALDVQSKESNTFTGDQVNILETMADQIAISLDNSRLYQESLQRLREVEEANRTATRTDWKDYLNEQRTASIAEETGLRVIEHKALREQAIAEGETTLGELTERNTVPFAVPIKLRDHILGAVVWELPAIAVNADRIQLAEELVNRLAITIDNARLFQTSRQAAARERVVNDIAAQLAGKTDIEEIMRTAVQEVGRALRLPEVSIRLGDRHMHHDDAHTNGTNGNHPADDDLEL